ncbi:MAG TPA: hypothetical protein VN939_05220 [Chthoniobacterales bacterium]|jgi:hypothetical protein|nr:hypothetical protein [Chthoniobacterales bacterium]
MSTDPLDNKEAADNNTEPFGEKKIGLTKRTIQQFKTQYEQYKIRKIEGTSQDRSSGETANATRWIMRFTFVLAGVGIAQGYIANITLDELQTEQRPWVSYADDIGVVEWSKDVRYTATDISFFIKLSVRNSGNLLAFFVHVEPNVVSDGFVTKQIDFIKSLKKSAPLLGLTFQKRYPHRFFDWS